MSDVARMVTSIVFSVPPQEVTEEMLEYLDQFEGLTIFRAKILAVANGGEDG